MGVLKTVFGWLMLKIDTAIYGLINIVYQFIDILARIKLFDDSVVGNVVNRIYTIIGVVMLFALAYSLLKAVINPDEFAKGESSFPKLISNVVISIATIALLPMVFQFAQNFQITILNHNTLYHIINGEDATIDDEQEPGRQMAYAVFSAFFHVNENWCQTQGLELESIGDVNQSECAAQIETSGLSSLLGSDLNLAESAAGYLNGTYSFANAFAWYGSAVSSDKVEYLIFLSTAGGAFVLYVLVNFCFDFALRAVKLAFFQIIAPVAVICRIIPGGKMKDVFSTWTKKTVSTYLEVFIRLAVIYLGVFLIGQVFSGNTLSQIQGPAVQVLIIKALIIMALIMFIKQAPKLLGEMFHLDTGGMSLGLRDKLQQGGMFAAGAIAGGAAVGLGRNAISAFKEKKGLIRGVASTFAGGLSGGVNSAKAGFGAKNFKDMFAASNTGAAKASENRLKRASYKASHSGFMGATVGHLHDAWDKAADYMSTGDAEYQMAMEAGKAYTGNYSTIKSEAESLRDKNATNMALTKRGMQQGDWKGTADQKAKLQELYGRYMVDANGNAKMSLAGLKAYLDSENSALSTLSEAERLKRAPEVASLEQLYSQLNDQARDMIIDASMMENPGDLIDGIDKDKYLKVESSVKNFVNQYQLDGSRVVDSSNSKTFGTIESAIKNDKKTYASAIKDISDAYEHNMTIASQKQAVREQAKKKREGSK